MIKIQSIFVANPDFKILYTNSFMKNFDEHQSDFITNLIKTISGFGNEEFKNKLYRIEFSDSMIDLIWFKNYVFIINTEMLENSNNMITEFNKFLAKLVSNLQQSENILHAIDTFKIEITIYNNRLFNQTHRSNSSSEFNILMSYISQSSGIPISHTVFEDTGNPLLLGPMISAIISFTNVFLHKSISMIQIGYYKIFLRKKEDKIYFLLMKDNQIHEFYNTEKRGSVDHLLDVMVQTIKLLPTISNDDLNAIIYTLILEEKHSFEKREAVDFDHLLQYGQNYIVHQFTMKDHLDNLRKR